MTAVAIDWFTLPPSYARVMRELKRLARFNAAHQCWASQEWLSEKAKVCTRHLRRVLVALERLGCITREHREGTSDLITVAEFFFARPRTPESAERTPKQATTESDAARAREDKPRVGSPVPGAVANTAAKNGWRAKLCEYTRLHEPENYNDRETWLWTDEPAARARREDIDRRMRACQDEEWLARGERIKRWLRLHGMLPAEETPPAPPEPVLPLPRHEPMYWRAPWSTERTPPRPVFLREESPERTAELCAMLPP